MKDWFNLEDLEKIGERQNPEPKDIYKNNRTGIVFNHDFPINGNLERDFGLVKQKYNRRIERLIHNIEASDTILVLYIQNPDQREETTNEDLIKVQALLQNRFKNTNIDLLYLYCKRGISKKEMQISYLSDNITKIIFDYDGYNKELPYVVNFKLLYKVFNEFKISNKFLTRKNICSRIIYKTLVTIRAIFGH